jgi:hypothetical protein
MTRSSPEYVLLIMRGHVYTHPSSLLLLLLLLSCIPEGVTSLQVVSSTMWKEDIIFVTKTFLAACLSSHECSVAYAFSDEPSMTGIAMVTALDEISLLVHSLHPSILHLVRLAANTSDFDQQAVAFIVDAWRYGCTGTATTEDGARACRCILAGTCGMNINHCVTYSPTPIYVLLVIVSISVAIHSVYVRTTMSTMLRKKADPPHPVHDTDEALSNISKGGEADPLPVQSSVSQGAWSGALRPMGVTKSGALQSHTYHGYVRLAHKG